MKHCFPCCQKSHQLQSKGTRSFSKPGSFNSASFRLTPLTQLLLSALCKTDPCGCYRGTSHVEDFQDKAGPSLLCCSRRCITNPPCWLAICHHEGCASEHSVWGSKQPKRSKSTGFPNSTRARFKYVQAVIVANEHFTLGAVVTIRVSEKSATFGLTILREHPAPHDAKHTEQNNAEPQNCVWKLKSASSLDKAIFQPLLQTVRVQTLQATIIVPAQAPGLTHLARNSWTASMKPESLFNGHHQSMTSLVVLSAWLPSHALVSATTRVRVFGSGRTGTKAAAACQFNTRYRKIRFQGNYNYTSLPFTRNILELDTVWGLWTLDVKTSHLHLHFTFNRVDKILGCFNSSRLGARETLPPSSKPKLRDTSEPISPIYLAFRAHPRSRKEGSACASEAGG